MIESTTLRCMYELKTEHDFTLDPQVVDVGSSESLLRTLHCPAGPIARFVWTWHRWHLS